MRRLYGQCVERLRQVSLTLRGGYGLTGTGSAFG